VDRQGVLSANPSCGKPIPDADSPYRRRCVWTSLWGQPEKQKLRLGAGAHGQPRGPPSESFERFGERLEWFGGPFSSSRKPCRQKTFRAREISHHRIAAPLRPSAALGGLRGRLRFAKQKRKPPTVPPDRTLGPIQDLLELILYDGRLSSAREPRRGRPAEPQGRSRMERIDSSRASRHPDAESVRSASESRSLVQGFRPPRRSPQWVLYPRDDPEPVVGVFENHHLC